MLRRFLTPLTAYATGLVALTTLVGCAFSGAVVGPASAPVDGKVALGRLLDGNRRYAAASASSSKPLAAQRAAVAQKQTPFAAIVACADSRVAPEIIFDQNLGDLFVIRTAGNLVDAYALGSLEYAVAHLGVRCVVVVGHERCGAVGAAVSGGHAEGHVKALVEAIKPAVARAKGRGGDALEAAVIENARLTAAKIRASKPALSKLAGGEVTIASAYYDLDSGTVRVNP
ncbi:MAG: carbonic anhydrase [Verrucomicrobia bacterium]|nr:carbonic anhydrase [Verrucomicrobiota bacterium]